MEIISAKGKYEFIKIVLLKTRYKKLTKKEKILVKKYLKFLTKYSKSQLKKLIKKWKQGLLFFNPARKKNKFHLVYSAQDIARLVETDIAHNCLSGQATKEIMKREFEIFKKTNYQNISRISISHLYNLRNHNRQYQSSGAMIFRKTNATQINIGLRRKPDPQGKPGYLRVDTVYQGDYMGQKGGYHINLVDKITQFEMVATVEKISEQYLRPVIEEALKLFPFMIYEFHSDNGSEYINGIVAKLLNKLRIELTKS
ncbi:transposase family protein [Patescibacteria group bacterium]|nr:transposase family protein [Patescibacteria group bacterium]MBU4579616.1 transposase family protein [Patescibacteria group bacterium]